MSKIYLQFELEKIKQNLMDKRDELVKSKLVCFDNSKQNKQLSQPVNERKKQELVTNFYIA